MKPKYFSLNRALVPLARTSIIVCATVGAATSLQADQTWTGATDAAWGTLTNWSGGAIPLPTENAVFDATSTANLTAIALGANRTINGITYTNPPSDVTIVAGSTLNINGGIDMSAATTNLSIGAGLNLSASGQQVWSVAPGRTLTLASLARTTSGGINNLNVGSAVRFPATGGTVKVGAVAIPVFVDAQGNPYATFGLDSYAGTDATGTVIASPPTAWTASIAAAFFGVPYAVGANFTQSGNGGVSGIVFNDPTTAFTLTLAAGTTFTGRGVLVTSNSVGGTITGGSLRPNRSASGAGGNSPMNFTQNSLLGDLRISNLSNASSSTTVSLVKNGVGRMILTDGTFHTGGTFINGGTLQVGEGGATGHINSTSNVVIQSGGSLVMNVSADLTVNAVFGGSGTFTQQGTGMTTLGGASAGYTGAITITGGAIAATSLANLGSGTSLTINGGRLRFLGAFDPTSRTVTIGSAGATFDTNGFDVSLAAPFASGSTGAVTKTGVGALTLAADNTYSGGTTVTAGTLVASAPTSSTGSGPVVVATGAGISGSGKVAGAVTVDSGGNLSPGAAGIGTLSVGGLNLNAGTTATFEFNNSPNNDKVAVTGALTINGGALTLLDVTGNAVAFTTPGTYNLISHTSPTSGAGATSLTVANAQPGFSYVFNDTGTMITLTIATTGVVSHWVTDGGGSWLTGTNWNTNPTVPNGVGQTAILDKVLTSPATLTLNGPVIVGAITFSSAPSGYTIAPGSGGSLTLNNGANASTIANNVGVHTISANLALASNTLLSSGSSAESLTLSGIVSGPGSLTKPGPGSLSLANSNNFGGLVTLTGGSTSFASGGLGNGNLTISGATLAWASGNSQDITNRTVSFGANPVTFDVGSNDVSLLTSAIGNGGAATFTKAGAGKLTLGNSPTFTGAVTIAAGNLQLGTGGATGIVAGQITNNGQLTVNLADGTTFENLVTGTGSFVHAGTGSLSLNAANTFTGLTSITAGSLRLLNPLALQGSTLHHVTGGGTISFDVLTAATLGGLEGNLNLSLMNGDAVPAPVALTAGGNNASTSYEGILSGGGSLTKLGTGTLTLTGSNTYTGTTLVSGGILALGPNGTLGGAPITVNTTGRMQVSGGSMTPTTGTFGVGSGGLLVEGGSAIFSDAVTASGSTGTTASALVKITDGVLSMPSLTLGRSGLNNSAEPAEAPVDTNFYLTGGVTTITGNLFIGTGSAQPNSSVVTRIDGGILTVGGAISVGLNNGGRWSTLDINGGELRSTDAVNGIVLGGPFVGSALLSVRSGLVTAEIVNFGQGAVNGNAVIRISGGELDVGAGGINLASTGVFTSEIRLAGGTLGAKANWSTTRPVNVSGTSASTINGGNQAGDPFDITFFGPLTGSGSLIKNGKGTVTLGGGNSYAGDTSVVEGTLKLASRNLSDDGTVSIDAAGTLELAYSGGDKVFGVVLGGNSMGDGIYGREGRGLPGVTETPRITGDGLLYVGIDVPVAPGYDAWAALPANGLTPGVKDGPNQDPDFDGITNQLEFVLGGNPSISSTAVLPKLSVDATNFIFTFNRQDDSIGQVALAFQYGSNLTGWTDIAIPESNLGGAVTIVPGSPADVITVSIPKGTNQTLFGRLRAVK